ncbi:pilus assembly protein CpaB [Mixta theicola]|nr:pilus assembly protein CpaB [Mixta theicola]
MQKKQFSTDENAPVVHQQGKKKVIVIAETLREIKTHDILSEKDYQIRAIEIDEEIQDIRNISPLGTNNLNGYLILHNLPKNSAILPDMVEAPNSETFILHSLKENEIPYDYRVRTQDESLLTSLSVGDKVSLYLRLVENEKGQLSSAAVASETGSALNKNIQKYVISRISGPLSVIEIKKGKNQEERGGYSHDETVGSVVLRISREQLAELRVVEKAGEVLLFPADGDKESYKKLSMDEVLKQFRVVKELRGGK